MTRMGRLAAVEQDQLKTATPGSTPGDPGRVHLKVTEGGRERIQAFEGVGTARKGGGVRETFTVRRIRPGVGVERFFFQAEDGIRDVAVTGVQMCALPISRSRSSRRRDAREVIFAKRQAIEALAHPSWEERSPMAESKEEATPRSRGKKVKDAAKGVLYGMAAHGHVTAALRTRMYLEHLFMFITLGDMLGVPVIPPYYSLKILPYAVPNIKSWKQRVFRERDFTDQVF